MKSVVNFYGALMVMGFSSLYGASLPYDHSRGQTWVATLELNDSLNHPLINWADQTFELRGFKEIKKALQVSSNVIYLEGDPKNQNWRIWIHHDDPLYERETQWVEAVASLLGIKAKKMEIQGYSVWLFDDDGVAMVFIYQSNSVELLRLKTYKERLVSNLKKNLESADFYWDRNDNIPEDGLSSEAYYPKLTLWIDHPGVQIIPAELKKYLQCEEFQEHVVKFQLTSTAEKSSLKVWNPLAKEAGPLVTWLFPQPCPQWRYPQFFPAGAVVYGEFPISGQGDLLDYIRGFEEKLGPEALKEFERNLQDFEAKYEFKVREDLLDIFKQGCAVGLYNRASVPKSLGVPEIFMMVTKSNANLIPMLKKKLVLQDIVIRSSESDNELLFQVKNGRQTHVLYWESRVLIYCNDIDFLRNCQAGVWAKKSPALMLPDELSNFGLHQSGYGNRIYMDSTIYKTFLQSQKLEHILAKIPWSTQHTPLQKNQVVDFLTGFNVWPFFKAELVQNRIEAELILNHKIIMSSPK